MKSFFRFLTVVAILFAFVGCGDRVPFKPKEPLKDAALVYVYVPEVITDGEDTDTSEYSIRINNKKYLQRIKEGEYLAFDLKPLNITLSATRSQVEEHALKVNLESGKIYYFKIQKLNDGQFSFERVPDAIGAKEIAKTGLAGSTKEDDSYVITEIIGMGKDDKKESAIIDRDVPKKQQVPQTQRVSATQNAPIYTPIESTSSKLDNIKKAYEMNKAGILSDEEFKALKEKLLSK